jgi:CRISPR-associated protein Cmr6
MKRRGKVTETIKEPFCPLYKEVVADQPWNKSAGAHRGLLFDKFADAWRTDEKSTYAFDKGGPMKEGAGKWLGKMAAKCGAPDRLDEACRRQQELVTAMSGKPVLLKNSSRFVTGLGREHPLDNGFAWHHTLGVPYLPASSLKGLLRAWYRENGSWDEAKKRWKESSTTRTLFGSHEQDENGREYGVGRFVLLDMLPMTTPQLSVDIMTPHYGLYYQNESGQIAPGDWHSPVPITFLAVEKEQTWQLGIVPRVSQRMLTQDELEELSTALIEAFEWLGAGAKTAAGYGRFERDSQAEERSRRDQEQRRIAIALQRERDEKLRGLPPDVAGLVKQADDEAWIADKNQNASFLNGVDRYLEQNAEPTSACIEWIRDNCLEFFWKGIWRDPVAMTGKKKDKHKHKSKRARELATKLKDMLISRQN